jgi:uncharacterized protein (TIGR04255 family)
MVAFPNAPRVVYKKTPLDQVKCQIRFPPILKIDTSPATFQDAIRAEFPGFEMKSTVNLPHGMPAALSNAFQQGMTLGEKSFWFVSENQNATVVLTKQELSLIVRRYDRWEPFQDKIARVLDSLVAAYAPSFFTHVCVRYTNTFRRSLLEATDIPWSRLLQPWVCGPIEPIGIADKVEGMQNRFVIRLDDGKGKVEAVCSLGVHSPTKEQIFVIEAHVFDDSRKELVDVLPRLNALHEQARLFFGWCITDELHESMQPAPC